MAVANCPTRNDENHGIQADDAILISSPVTDIVHYRTASQDNEEDMTPSEVRTHFRPHHPTPGTVVIMDIGKLYSITYHDSNALTKFPQSGALDVFCRPKCKKVLL